MPAVLRAYLRLLHESPFAGAILGSAVSAAAGDVLAQTMTAAGMDADQEDDAHGSPFAAMAAVVNRPRPTEGAATEMGAVRTVRFATIVGTLVGGIGTLWFRRLMVPFPGWKSDVAVRTLLDQTLFAPAVLALTIGGVTCASTGEVGYALHRVRHDTIHPMTTMWTIWGGGVAVSYLLVPAPLQAVYAAGVSTLWCACVSLRVHRSTPWRGKRDLEQMTSFLRSTRRLE